MGALGVVVLVLALARELFPVVAWAVLAPVLLLLALVALLLAHVAHVGPRFAAPALYKGSNSRFDVPALNLPHLVALLRACVALLWLQCVKLALARFLLQAYLSAVAPVYPVLAFLLFRVTHLPGICAPLLRLLVAPLHGATVSRVGIVLLLYLWLLLLAHCLRREA